MENPINEFFQMQDTSTLNGDSSIIFPSYVSCIKINGRPILPPLITEERRRELKTYRTKAIEIENRLAKRKNKPPIHSQSNGISSALSRKEELTTPVRPATLQFLPNVPDQKITLSSSGQGQDQTRTGVEECKRSDTISSQKSTNIRSKTYRSTLEQRLTSEEPYSKTKKNFYEQSPIIEENYSPMMGEPLESDDSRKERKRWSPLNVDSINSLRVEKSNGDAHSIVDNSIVSMDDVENSSGTLTESPNLLRQNSYTLLTSSPALLQYLETQKESGKGQRSHSGRKTWDLTKARKKWTPGDVDAGMDKENSTCLEDFAVFQTRVVRNSSPNEGRHMNSYTDDGSTSPSSYSFKTNSPKFQKIKCKVKNRRGPKSSHHHKTSVPSPSPMSSADQVPKVVRSTPGPEPTLLVPLQVKEELSYLSELLLKMRMEHEREKKELESRHRSEMKELEVLFKKRETELHRVLQESPMYPRSIYSHYSEPVGEEGKFHTQMMGDGRHNPSEVTKRPHSAKDYYSPSCVDQGSRRTRSMDFNQGVPSAQDTDLDVSFQDSVQSKEIYPGMDALETDTVSNCSGRSSTISSDSKLESMPLLDIKKSSSKHFELSPEEYQKYNQAAAIITAAARGFLTRRLLRTAHVQGLITTLRDAISCATQLHGASDLGESDVDLMKRLGRQIEAAWEAVYAVFFDTDPHSKMQLISADRERLRSISAKHSSNEPKKRISSATLKSLRRKSGSELLMSKSQIANGSPAAAAARRVRSRMVASYPSPSVRYKIK